MMSYVFYFILLVIVIVILNGIFNRVQEYISCPKDIRKEISNELCDEVNYQLRKQGYTFWEVAIGLVGKEIISPDYDNDEGLPMYKFKVEIKTERTLSQIARGLLMIKTKSFKPYGELLLKCNDKVVFPIDYIDFINSEKRYLVRVYLKTWWQNTDKLNDSFQKGRESGKNFKGFFND